MCKGCPQFREKIPSSQNQYPNPNIVNKFVDRGFKAIYAWQVNFPENSKAQLGLCNVTPLSLYATHLCIILGFWFEP